MVVFPTPKQLMQHTSTPCSTERAGMGTHPQLHLAPLKTRNLQRMA